MSTTLRWHATEAIMANVALPVPCIPMRTIDALGSNTRRHSYGEGTGVDLDEFGKLRSLAAGGEGVGSELRPFIAIPPACMLAKDRFVLVVMEAMAYEFRCGMQSRLRSKAWYVGAVLTQLNRCPGGVLASHVMRG